MTSSRTLPTSETGALPPNRLGLPDLAFVGKAGAGKSTAAVLLAEFGYRPLSFAQPLKDIAAKLWGEDARTDRDKLQKLGVAVRQIAPDTWVDLALDSARLGLGLGQVGRGPVAVDDCRFENEWWALKGNGFVVVRITAPLSTRIDRLKANGKWQDEGQLEHESETAIDHLDADYTLANDLSTNDLAEELTTILLKERKRR